MLAPISYLTDAYVFPFCESSTATLNAPSKAESCIFSDPPSERRCLMSALHLHKDPLCLAQVVEEINARVDWELNRLEEVISAGNEVL